MIDIGKLRVRSTQMDNAPDGRPNWGWASLNAWYLVALGKVWSVATGIPLHQALLSAAMWSGPILYFLVLTTILALGLVTRNFPAAAAAALILGTAPRVYEDLAYAVPGHHGWHDLACFATLAIWAAAIRKKGLATMVCSCRFGWSDRDLDRCNPASVRPRRRRARDSGGLDRGLGRASEAIENFDREWSGRSPASGVLP